MFSYKISTMLLDKSGKTFLFPIPPPLTILASLPSQPNTLNSPFSILTQPFRAGGADSENTNIPFKSIATLLNVHTLSVRQPPLRIDSSFSVRDYIKDYSPGSGWLSIRLLRKRKESGSNQKTSCRCATVRSRAQRRL